MEYRAHWRGHAVDSLGSDQPTIDNPVSVCVISYPEDTRRAKVDIAEQFPGR